MNVLRYRRAIALLLAITTSVLPVSRAFAAGPGTGEVVAAAKQVHDVALQSGGALSGVVVDAEGRPLAFERLRLLRNGEVVEATSDADGRFGFHGLKSGVYELSASQATLACRCWTPSAAPPAAAKQLLFVADEAVQRGQRPIADFLTGPVLIGLIIAAAIAIPIAIHNSQNSAS